MNRLTLLQDGGYAVHDCYGGKVDGGYRREELTTLNPHASKHDTESAIVWYSNGGNCEIVDNRIK